jgi:hypothetical protein
LAFVPGPFDDLILLVPQRTDVERDAVAAQWVLHGGQVIRLDRFWEPPVLDAKRVRVYGNDTFCLVLAQKLGLTLISPPDDLLLHLDASMLGRRLEGLPLADINRLRYPIFVKSMVPKLFTARVYESAQELCDETRGLEPETLVLASEIVELTAEVRAFVLDGEVETFAAYEGTNVDLDAARAFAAHVAAVDRLPRTCVLDVGPILGGGWAVIEANASWGAGLNGCDPVAAARCIAAACEG